MSSDRITLQCSTCGAAVLSKNMARHRREVHKFTLPPTPTRSVSHDGSLSSQARSRLNTSRSDDCPDLQIDYPSEMEKAGLDLAATKLLIQHHIYSEAKLIKFLEENFPNVKPEQRRALVVGAAAGARCAAMSFFTVLGNQHSPDPAKRLMAINAHSELSFWNRGLMNELYIPSLSASAESTDESTASGENSEGEFAVPTLSTLNTIDLANLRLPVPMDAVRQDFDAATAAIMAVCVPSNTSEVFFVDQARPSADVSTGSASASRDLPNVETATERPVTDKRPLSDESLAVPYVPHQTSASVVSETYEPTPRDQLAAMRSSTATDLLTVARSSPIASFEPISTDRPVTVEVPSGADVQERPPTEDQSLFTATARITFSSTSSYATSSRFTSRPVGVGEGVQRSSAS